MFENFGQRHDPQEQEIHVADVLMNTQTDNSLPQLTYEAEEIHHCEICQCDNRHKGFFTQRAHDGQVMMKYCRTCGVYIHIGMEKILTDLAHEMLGKIFTELGEELTSKGASKKPREAKDDPSPPAHTRHPGYTPNPDNYANN
jgi:hypothetical protein